MLRNTISSGADAVSTIMTQSVNPQVTTASYDGTVRLWDMGMGKSITTLTNHKKAVRAAAMHPAEYVYMHIYARVHVIGSVDLLMC